MQPTPKQAQSIASTSFVETCIKSRINNVPLKKAQTFIWLWSLLLFFQNPITTTLLSYLSRFEWIRIESIRKRGIDGMIHLETTVAELIEIVKDQKLSNVQIKELLEGLGETLSKNIISEIYHAAGFNVINARKKIFEPSETANYEMTIRDAIVYARSARLEKEKKATPKLKSISTKEPVPVVTRSPKKVEPVEQFAGINVPNPFSLEAPEQAQDFILAALGITKNQLTILQQLTDESQFVGTNSNESIHAAVKQLGGRERMNKTYYISKEIIERTAAFCEDKNVKVSQFVEMALLEAIKKYG